LEGEVRREVLGEGDRRLTIIIDLLQRILMLILVQIYKTWRTAISSG